MKIHNIALMVLVGGAGFFGIHFLNATDNADDKWISEFVSESLSTL